MNFTEMIKERSFGEVQANVSQKAEDFIAELCQKVLERDELAALVTLVIFSSQNMFLIGKPGVAKTKLLKLAINAVKDTESFEHLMMYDTKKEAIFGTSVIAPNGELVHRFEHTAVTAHYVLMDEFFKGNSEVINGWLGMASEDREYHPGGMLPIKVPLRTLFAASNEFHQGEALDAMNDRLPIRYDVLRIQEDDNFIAMIEGDFDKNSEFETVISLDMVDYVSQHAASFISIPKELSSSLTRLKNRLISEEEIAASDRRFISAVYIMKVSAYLNNRLEINESDFFLLNHIIWNDYGEKERAKDAIYRHVFTSEKYIVNLLQKAEGKFSEINNYKDRFVSDFLMKKLVVAVTEVEEYYLEHIGYVEQIMTHLDNAYVLIEEILNIYNNNKSINAMIKKNIFVLKMEDSVFVDGLYERVKSCKKDYKSLYSYLLVFKKDCPNTRAYVEYEGVASAKT